MNFNKSFRIFLCLSILHLTAVYSTSASASDSALELEQDDQLINKECSLPQTPSYLLQLEVSDILLSPESKPGDVIGHFTLKSSTFICKENDGAHNQLYTWYLQNVPNATESTYSPTVCNIGITGVGIRYYDYSGAAIPCNFRGNVFYIPKKTPQSTMPDKKFAELIRTNESLPAPGHYAFSIDAIASAYFYGGSKTTQWGQINTTGNTSILVSSCVLDTSIENVDFGALHLDDEAHSVARSFQLTFSGCSDEEQISNFKNTAKLIFTSSQMKSDGSVGNCTNSDCAQNVSINLADSAGVIDLTKQYPIKDKSDSLVYNFNANLTYSSNSKAGKIDSSLAIVVSYF